MLPLKLQIILNFGFKNTYNGRFNVPQSFRGSMFRLNYQPPFGKGASTPPLNSWLDSWTLALLITTNKKICLPESSRLHKLSFSQWQRSCVIWRAISLAGHLTIYLQLIKKCLIYSITAYTTHKIVNRLYVRESIFWIMWCLNVRSQEKKYSSKLNSGYVQCTGPGKPGKSCNCILAFSRTGKSWKKATGPGNLAKIMNCMESSNEN